MPKPVIKLPYLHAGKFGSMQWPAANDFWPGLSGEESVNTFRPDYPLNPHEAGRELEKMRQMDLRDLEAMLHAADRRTYVDDSALKDELGSLAAFTGSVTQAGAESAVLTRLKTQAQRMLIWCWLAEERALEIMEIERACNSTDKKLLCALGENENLTPLENNPGADLALLAPWRVCVANAAFFLPDDCAIFVEGKMREEMEEFLDFSPLEKRVDYEANMLPPDLPENIFVVRAPLWRVLGHTGPASRLEGASGKVLKEIYGREFLWLLRKRG